MCVFVCVFVCSGMFVLCVWCVVLRCCRCVCSLCVLYMMFVCASWFGCVCFVLC